MSGGSVLNFTNRRLSEFFSDDFGINIYDDKYNYSSGSKANRMRAFWQLADNNSVGQTIIRLIEYIKSQILIGDLKKEDFPQDLIDYAKNIADKLFGKQSPHSELPEDEFLNREFRNLDIDKLGLDGTVTSILQQRIDEIKKCLSVKASLSVIFLCGSILEGMLLGIASINPKEFNQSLVSPKDKIGKVKPLHEWSLNSFIDVARELNILGEDVKKFSHALQDFRNYIHPYQQMSSKFNPDEHTAKICWQVLQVAIIQLSK